MNDQLRIRSAAQRLILTITLVIIGLGLIGLFGPRAYHAYARLQQRALPTGTTDVAAIRGWMTVPYIARAFRVPEDALFATLGIPKAGNERLSLNRLARKYGRDPLAIHQAIQQALLRYQRTALPGSGGAPWRAKILLTRFFMIPLAPPINLIAGSSHYAFGRFLLFAIPGELIGVALYGGLGYLFADQWETLSDLADGLNGVLIGLLALATGGALAYAYRRRRAAPAHVEIERR